MSLKAFHIFFILCSIVVSAWIGFWQLGQENGFGLFSAQYLGACFIALAAALAVYFIWFLVKMRKVGGGT
jgi:hypothetical protein